LVDHLPLMQANQEKWEEEPEFGNRIFHANRALGSVPQEAELKSILLQGVGREVRALERNFSTQGRTFPKLRTFLDKTGEATREDRRVKLHSKLKGSTFRSAGGEEREPRRDRTAASGALPVGAASAAAALAVTDCGTEEERAERAAILAASVASPYYGSPGDAPVLPVDLLTPAPGWQKQPAGGGRPEMYPVRPGWAAGAEPWRRVPRSLRARVPCSRTPTVLLDSPEAGRPHRAAGEGEVRPSRRPHPCGGGPAPSVATGGAGNGSAPPRSLRCERPDARCARSSRRTVAGGNPSRHRPCLWKRDHRSRLRPRQWPPVGPLRCVQPLSSTQWKRTTGRTRTPRQTKAEAPPSNGQRGTTNPATRTAAPAMPRETCKGQPSEWAAHGRCQPHGAPALLHHSEPPAPSPPAEGRSGLPASARLLPSRRRAAGGAQRRLIGGPESGASPGGASSRHGSPSVAAGRRLGTGPWPLRPPRVVFRGWHPGGRFRRRGTHRGGVPEAPRWTRPTRAYPLSAPCRRRRRPRGASRYPVWGRGGAAVEPAQLPYRPLAGP